MEADLHIHTSRYSGCSTIDPVAAVRKAKILGLGAIAFTEHGIRWPDDEIALLVQRSGVEDLLVIPGQEVACYSPSGKFQGEFLVFGYQHSLGSNKPAERVIELVHGEGGVVIAAHPFKRQKVGHGFYGTGLSTLDLDVDGLEIVHPDYDIEGQAMALQMMQDKRIAGLGCSDAHDLGAIGVCRTIFERDIASVGLLAAEIRSRRVRASRFTR
jgi:predicted metal-dependent phosphoesterase TrpH